MKLALIVGGKAGNLNYLDESLQKVKDTLDKYSQFKVIHLQANGIDELHKLFINSDDNKNIEELIFFYIGHGKINHTLETSIFELEITPTIKTSISDILLKIKEYINPKKTFIVVDACESGQILEDLHTRDLNNVYLFSSCTKYQKSYEDSTLKCTRFSYYFCKAIEKCTKIKNWENIEEHIRETFKILNEKDSNKQQTPKAIDPYSIKDTILVEDIIEDDIPANENLYFTIELEEKAKDKYSFTIWLESEDKTYEKSEYTNDEVLDINSILDNVDNFLTNNKKYKAIQSGNKFIFFVVPKKLMANGLLEYRLSSGITFGSKYTVFLRALERFRDNEYNNQRKNYRLADWKGNWESYKTKEQQFLKDVSLSISSNITDAIPTKLALNKPLIIIKNKPIEDTFEYLYKSAVSIALWANSCKEPEKFEQTIKDSNKKLNQLYTQIEDFDPLVTGLDSKILMLYDNPYNLPPDEEAIFTTPQ